MILCVFGLICHEGRALRMFILIFDESGALSCTDTAEQVVYMVYGPFHLQGIPCRNFYDGHYMIKCEVVFSVREMMDLGLRVMGLLCLVCAGHVFR